MKFVIVFGLTIYCYFLAIDAIFETIKRFEPNNPETLKHAYLVNGETLFIDLYTYTSFPILIWEIWDILANTTFMKSG